MSNIDKLIDVINKNTYANKESYIKRLRIISLSVKDKKNYTESFINELNSLLSPLEKFKPYELEFLLNFSTLSYKCKEYLLLDLTEKELEIINSIDDKIINSIEFYRNIKEEIDIKKLLRKLKIKNNSFINNEEIDYIVKLSKENFDNKTLIDILKEINYINESVFNKYGIDYFEDYEMDENNLKITNVSFDELKDLLLNYNIKVSLFSDELKNMLVKYGNLENMKSILEFLKKEEVISEYNMLDSEILARTLIYSNVSNLEKLKNENDIDFKTLVLKIPTVLYPIIKERKYSNNREENSNISNIRSGNMTNYINNSKLIKTIGISFDEVWNKCFSFFMQSYKANKDSINALDAYNISLFDNNRLKNIFSVLGNRNPSIIDIYDLALEVDAKEYALKAPSSLSPAQMYKFNLIKLARKKGLSDNEIFGYYTSESKEIYLRMKYLSSKLNFNEDSIDSLYDKVLVNIPNQKIYDNIFDISNLNVLSNDILNDINISALERFSESDDLYNFNGTRISKKKVLRRYLALKNNNKAGSMSSLIYCIIYGSLLDEKEFNDIYTLVKDSVTLEDDEDIYIIDNTKKDNSFGGK